MPALPEQLLEILGSKAASKISTLPGNENENYLLRSSRKWSHIKRSRDEMDDLLFQRVGNYYKAYYDIPSLEASF